jgi:hypothetical protein
VRTGANTLLYESLGDFGVEFGGLRAASLLEVRYLGTSVILDYVVGQRLFGINTSRNKPEFLSFTRR